MRAQRGITADSTARVARKPQVADKALLDAAAQGNQAALRALFMRHSDRIYRFALRLTGSATIAEETVSDVFLEVWRTGKSFQGRSQVSTWLMGIARNKALSALAAQHPTGELDLDEAPEVAVRDQADNPEESLDRRDRSSVIQSCLRQLPNAQRDIIDLFYLREKSLPEVVAIIGALQSTVKTRMFYARNKMAELLKQQGIDSARA
jgi:RNA polymerase sigma-70 factor, ECF subfamily